MLTANESKLFELALDAAQTAVGVSILAATEGVQGVGDRLNILRKAPIRKLFFLRQLKEELAAEGLEFSTVGAVNWEAVIEFLVKYGPIILQLILTLL